MKKRQDEQCPATSSMSEGNPIAGQASPRARSYRKTVFKCFAVFIALVVAAVSSEIAARFYFSQRSDLEKLRQFLAGEKGRPADDGTSPGARYVGQPYLTYVPAPNYKQGLNYHNEQGYRGKAVSMERRPGVARVLCLGGSTTYGDGVEDSNATYPAQLEKVNDACFPVAVYPNLFEERPVYGVMGVPLITEINNKNIGI